MKGNGASKWVFRFTVITVFFSFCLIGLGGLVTSKEVGLVVADWPTSLHRHMFLLPMDEWVGKFGIFEEHSHRLFASLVGLLTAGITCWMWVRESTGAIRNFAVGGILLTLGLMGIRSQAMFVFTGGVAAAMIYISIAQLYLDRKQLKWWATLAYGMVIVQGVLGGLRVTEQNNQIGIIHGTLAQVFLVVLALIALFCSNWWRKTRVASNPDERVPRVVRAHFLYATILVLLQLVIGASMRHQHAGLAAWDFPKAHGQWWPATDQDSMARYNQGRAELQKKLYEDRKAFDSEGRPVIFLHSFREIQPGQITLHMIHRLIAILILGLVLGAVMLTRKKLGGRHLLCKVALFWLGLVLVQILLGALTVLKYKPADIATMHVLFGSLALITGALGAVISWNLYLPAIDVESGKNGDVKIKQAEALG